MHEKIFIFLAMGAMIFNFIYLFDQRKTLKQDDDADLSMVPNALLNEVEQQIKDGYVLTSVTNGRVRLIKTQRYWFSLFLFPLLPNAINTIINSSFLCNIYGVELSIGKQGVELSTY